MQKKTRPSVCWIEISKCYRNASSCLPDNTVPRCKTSSIFCTCKIRANKINLTNPGHNANDRFSRHTHHNSLHILQLIVDRIYVSSAICQILLGLLYVHIELDECIWSCDGVHTASVALMELLCQILQIVECQTFRVHFITHNQVADFVFDQIAVMKGERENILNRTGREHLHPSKLNWPTGIDMGQFRWSSAAVNERLTSGTAISPGSGTLTHCGQTEKTRPNNLIMENDSVSSRVEICTCSSSCIVPTNGRPSTTRAIIVIIAMLIYCFLSFVFHNAN